MAVSVVVAVAVCCFCSAAAVINLSLEDGRLIGSNISDHLLITGSRNATSIRREWRTTNGPPG